MTKQVKDIPTVGPAKGTFTIVVEDKSCTLRKLDRATYKIVHSIITGSVMGGGDDSMLDAGQIILNTCWLDGDVELKDDHSEENMEYNFAACQQAMTLIEAKSGSIKKN